MRCRSAIIGGISLSLANGACHSEPTADAAPRRQAMAATASTVPSQIVIFGDGRRERLGTDGLLRPIGEDEIRPTTSPAAKLDATARDRAERLAAAYLADHHLEWGTCVFAIGAANGYHLTYGTASAATTAPATMPTTGQPYFLLPMVPHELVVRPDAEVEIVRP